MDMVQKNGLFEIAVLKRTIYGWLLCYSTQITDDVIGYLDNEEVIEILEKIKNLEGDKNE